MSDSPIRLSGRERYEFERSVIGRFGKSKQLVIRILLDSAGGKAECWPSNKMLAKASGLKVRAIQYVMSSLEADGAIRIFVDSSFSGQRRIVILGHPGSQGLLKRYGHAKNAPQMQARDAVRVAQQSNGVQQAAHILGNEPQKEITSSSDHGPQDVLKRFFPWAKPEPE